MIRARRLPEVPAPPIVDDPAILGSYLEDASGAPAGMAIGLARPSSVSEAAAVLRLAAARGWSVLPQAARSSLTGGAIPAGGIVVSVERLVHLEEPASGPAGPTIRVGAGVRLCDLQRHVAGFGLYYPPVPTYRQALIGGAVSTHAGGAATFKYGPTRDWVQGLQVLLANGDLVDVARGDAVGGRGRPFHLTLADGTFLAVPAPRHTLPALRKISAGYFAAEPLDLVDLFVGSEGTLGLITEVTVRLAPRPQTVLSGWVFPSEAGTALDLAAALRTATLEARERGDPHGIDVRAIEWLDAACLDLLRVHGAARRLRIGLPDQARAALYFETELSEPLDDERVEALLAERLAGRAPRGAPALAHLLALLEEHGALDTLELGFPEDERRQDTLVALREAVPLCVNEILAARRRAEPAVRKVGGDLAVPFEELRGMLEAIGDAFRRRGLEFAVWGHLADGNLHPNALPRDAAEVQAGFEVLLELGELAMRRGGCPLSEHGVGRSALKQELLQRFVGPAAIDRMRDVKRALDPDGRFAPGVLFPPLSAARSS